MSVEILSPAGNMESLTAALRCGADAVYIGGKKFSARANADNFTIEEIKQAADLCHLYGSKLHVAVNTICFNEEVNSVAEYIEELAKCNIDAFIIQDLGVCRLAKEIAPDIERHASTQMTIHTPMGAKWVKRNGFSRVVLARELSFDKIKEICKVGIDVECFVHGALCMCVSGQCYMSAMIGGRSANRGGCAQSCRLPFSADNREYYALSLKDSSLVEHIKEMEEAGVLSFKIEGRMKRPEYVAAATKAMKEAASGIKPDMKLLQDIFSRSGFTDGYFTGKRENMFGTRRKEDVVSAKTVFPIIHEYYRKPYKARTIDFDVTVKKDIPLEVMAKDSAGNSACVISDIPQVASKKQVTKEEVEKQFSKLGDTVYKIGKINCSLDDGLFVPSSVFNSLRREIVQKIDEKQLERYKNNQNIKKYVSEKSDFVYREKNPELVVSVRNSIQFDEAFKNIKYVSAIVLPLDMAYLAEGLPDKNKIYISVPRFNISEKKVFFQMKELKEKGFKDFLCGNIAYVEIAKILGVNIHADFGMNIVNDISVSELEKNGVKSFVASPEMKLSQVKNLNSSIKKGIFAYGRLPLMITRNCPVKNQLGNCKECPHELKDRTNRKMKVYCRYGMTEIFNSEKIYLANKLESIKNIDFMLLSFTDEDKKDVRKIILDYLKGAENAPVGSTNGLYFRGIK